MKLIFGEIEIRIRASVLIMPVLALVAGFFIEYIVVFISMLLHEISHIAAAVIWGIKTDVFSVSMLGFSAAIRVRDCNWRKQLFIYFAGPALNLLVFLVAMTLEHILLSDHEYIILLSVTNLFMGMFNLLPVLPLDGGRIVFVLLSEGMGTNAAGKIVRRLALLFASLIILAGVYQLCITFFNVSLIIIGIYIIIALNAGRLESGMMSIREIIYRRSRLIKRGIYPARDLVAMKDTLLAEALKNMDFDRFHIIHVLDDDLHVIGSYTENDIIGALGEGSNDLTFGQLADLRQKETS